MVLVLFLLALAFGQRVPAAAPGDALYFDGRGSYLELPPHVLDGYGELTIESWIRVERVGFFTRFFEFGTQGDRWTAAWQASFNIHTGQRESASWAITDGLLSRWDEMGWVHLAVTGNGRSFRGYLNGTEFVAETNSLPFHPGGNGRRYYFGKDTFGGEEEDFVGFMDGIRIWNRVLSPSEVQASMMKPAPWGTPGLVALVDASTQQVRAQDGTIHPALFRGGLTWKPSGRDPVSTAPSWRPDLWIWSSQNRFRIRPISLFLLRP